MLGPGSPGLLVILIAFSLLQHVPYSLMTTTMYSALADMADENELRFGERQEGVLFSTQTFFARLDQAVGAALAGGVLTLVAFPKSAVPGHVAAPVLAGVALAYIVSTVPGLAAAAAYLRYAATRAGLDQLRA